MEGARNTRLDRLCERIGEGRGLMGKLRAEEQADTSTALRIMRELKMHSYQHAGVEMARVPGEEKLRVRAKQDGEATAAVMEEENEPATSESSEFAADRAADLEAAD